jgi:hypothetical protein
MNLQGKRLLRNFVAGQWDFREPCNMAPAYLDNFTLDILTTCIVFGHMLPSCLRLASCRVQTGIINRITKKLYTLLYRKNKGKMA